MKRNEFLKQLLLSLSALPQAEQDKAYAFYAEIIDDSIEDGMSEDEAVAKLGGMEEIVEQIVSDVPITVLLKSRVEPKRRGRLTVLLLVLGFPVWLPLLITAVVVPLTLFAVLWVLNAVLWAVCAALAAAALGGVAGLFVVPGIGMKLMYLGTALAAAGFTVPSVLGVLAVHRQIVRLTVLLWKKMKKSLFKKRGNTE